MRPDSVTATVARLVLWAVLSAAPGLSGAAADETPGAWLGVFLDDAVDGGVQIVGIVPGSPADLGGLRSGDVVLHAEGRALVHRAELARLLDDKAPGDELGLHLVREGHALNLRVLLGRRSAGEGLRVPRPEWPFPTDSALFPSSAAAGVSLADMTPELRAHFGASRERGVLVTEVRAGSAADRAGVRVGDVIVALGEQPVSDAQRLRTELSAPGRSGALLALEVVRSGESQRLELASSPALVPARAPRLVRVPAPPASAAGPAAVAPAPAGSSLERALQSEIERLERRIEQLRRQLDEVREP